METSCERKYSVAIMKRNKTIFVGIAVSVFIAAFFLGVGYSSLQEKKGDISKPLLRINTQQAINNAQIFSKQKDEEREMNMLVFMQRLQKARTTDEFGKLFDEKLPGTDTATLLQEEVMKRMVIKKWAETAPMQCLQKLESSEEGTKFLFSLFSGWTSKDPDSSISFYEENIRSNKNNDSIKILAAIMTEYTKLFPEKAWNWLESQNDKLPKSLIYGNKLNFLSAVSQKNPELIPDYIEKTGSLDLSKIAYYLGKGWGDHNAESKEWMENLPYNSKLQAESGWIMQTCKGDIEKIHEKLANFTEKERTDILNILAPRLLNAGALNIEEQVGWIIDNVPEEKMSSDIKFAIRSWMKEDGIAAKNWLDALPLGNQKTFLEKLYKERSPFAK